MRKIVFLSLVSLLLSASAFAQTIAVGKYHTKEAPDKAFLANMRAIPLNEFAIKSSDKEQGTIQASMIDATGKSEFASLFVMITKEGESTLIEATFTRNSGFFGGGKPVKWAQKYGETLKTSLPDLTIDVAKVEKK